MKTIRIFAFMLVAMASGCLSRTWLPPEVDGTVVDANSKQPIGGVEVVREDGKEEKIVATTDVSGHFHVAATRVVRFEIPSPFLGYRKDGVMLRFRKSGYSQCYYPCRMIYTTDGHSDHAALLEIGLKPEPNQAPLPTPVSVTPAAGAPVAPATGAAEL